MMRGMRGLEGLWLHVEMHAVEWPLALQVASGTSGGTFEEGACRCSTGGQHSQEGSLA